MKTILILNDGKKVATCTWSGEGPVSCTAEGDNERFVHSLMSNGVPGVDGVDHLPSEGLAFIDALFYHFHGPYWIATEI